MQNSAEQGPEPMHELLAQWLTCEQQEATCCRIIFTNAQMTKYLMGGCSAPRQGRRCTGASCRYPVIQPCLPAFHITCAASSPHASSVLHCCSEKCMRVSLSMLCLCTTGMEYCCSAWSGLYTPAQHQRQLPPVPGVQGPTAAGNVFMCWCCCRQHGRRGDNLQRLW